MKIFKINADTDFNALCDDIKPQITGQKIMQKKSNLHFFYLKDIKAPAANILKQDALSVGAELVCNDSVILGQGLSNALLIANDKQVELLAKKEALQDFELKNLAKFLNLKFKKPTKPEIMGVLNINDDSFNASSRINLNDGISRIEAMIENGADIIDLGGVSSRPGSEYCGEKVEFERIEKIISEIYRLNLHEKVKFSLDTFSGYCAEFALNHGFCIINDIAANLELCKIVKRYGATYVLMHMQGNPKTMQNSPTYSDLIFQIDEFFASNLAKIAEFELENVVLDVGIGFGKTPKQNLLLIKHLEHFLHFEKPLLVGASRKSVIDFYSPSSVENRLAGSLFLHQKAFENGASIIRTHDVKEHKQLFDLIGAMNSLSTW